MKTATPEALVRFTPRDQYETPLEVPKDKKSKPAPPKLKKDAISYYFRVPTPADKAAFKRRLLEKGIREWSMNRQLGLLEKEVTSLIKEGAPGWSQFELDVVVDFRNLVAEDIRKALRMHHPVGDVMDRVMDESAAWQSMEIDRESYAIEAGTVFCKMFLRAIEGFATEVDVDPSGEVTDATIAGLIPNHVEEIHLYQESTFWGPDAREAKNSGSPSRSDSSPGSSTGTARANGSRRNARGKTTSGTSNASDGQSSGSIPAT